MTEVKPGQVWRCKYSSMHYSSTARDTVRGMPWWTMRLDGANASIGVYEWMLLEDYVLVKEAP